MRGGKARGGGSKIIKNLYQGVDRRDTFLLLFSTWSGGYLREAPVSGAAVPALVFSLADREPVELHG